MFNSPIKIGPLEVPNGVFLAPLAGVSDVPFRRICQELQAGLTFVEMLTAGSVLHGMKKSLAAMTRHASEQILGIQVTGPSAQDVAEAVKALDQRPFDIIDINMGCPVKKVVSKGSGCAILKDPERVSETVARCRDATRKALSVKVRLGYCRDSVIIEELGRRIAEAGADMFTVHGRTRSENYGVPVDYQGIRTGLDQARSLHPPIVTVGNGDIVDTASAKKMAGETGCDALMVSRGALGNPWIFRDILSGEKGKTTVEEWLDTLLRHLDYHEAFHGKNRHATITARKHILWYVNGFPDIKTLRGKITQFDSLDEVREHLKAFVKTLPPGHVRYENLPPDQTYDPKEAMDREKDRGVGEEDL